MERGQTTSISFLLLLERLSADERAAFPLREIFDFSHAKATRMLGLSEGSCRQRLHLLAAWRETSLYSERECAAPAWAEALTHLAGHDAVADFVYEQVRAQFSKEELVKLTLLATLINSWNRIKIAVRTKAPGYQPGMYH